MVRRELAHEGEEVTLRDYLRVLRRRKLFVLLSVPLCVVAAFALSVLQTPVYAGKAEVLLQAPGQESPFDPQTGQRNDPARTLQTEIQVLESQPVRAAVRDKLHTAPKVTATPVGQTDVIQVRVESTKPKLAADAANAYANAYIDYRRKQAVDSLLAAAQQVQGKVDDLQGRIDSLKPGAPPSSPGAGQTVDSERNALIQQQALFRQRLDQLQVDAALRSGGAQLVTPAVVATSPVRPRPVRNGILGLVGGLLLGVGLAFLVEHLDDSLKTKDDLERVTGKLPVLGLIPSVAGWRSREEPRVVSLADPTSPAAEAYRTLRTAVQFLAVDRPTGTLQVTSPSAGEGKTTAVANLGVALTRVGRRVIMVCCDLRRPRINDFFGLSGSVGLTSVILGEVPLDEAVQEVPGVDGLMLLASGPLPPNPSELLGSKRATGVIATLRNEADVVLLDSPPVLPVTDALVLSAQVDAVLLVCASGMTSQSEAARAVELLQQVNAPLLGTVLNGAGQDGGYGYDYRYYGSGNGSAARSARPPSPTRAEGQTA